MIKRIGVEKTKKSNIAIKVLVVTLALCFLIPYFMVKDIEAGVDIDAIVVSKRHNVHSKVIEVPKSTQLPVRKEKALKIAENVNKDEIADKIYERFIVHGHEAAVTAVAVAMAESSMRPHAYNSNGNGSTDTGLFQINSIHGYSKQKLLDPDFNIDVAYKLYKRQGWRPWVAYNTGRYKKYLSYK